MQITNGGYEPEGKWIADAHKINKETGLSVETFIAVYNICSALKADKDESGKTIQNSRGRKRKAVIDSMVQSYNARQQLYEVLDVGKSLR